MAIAFRELPWFVQALVFLGLAVVIIAAGLYVPYSPIQGVKSELDQKRSELQGMRNEVTQLQVYDRRLAELRAEKEALEKQLATLRAIVPEEKEVDEFIRMLQGAASAANVSIRRFTAKPVASKGFYNEMPFELEVDGPYYSVLDFFARMGRLSRIINVGDLDFVGIGEAKGSKYPFRAGTTVTGTFTATTFFTKGAEAAAKQAGKQPGKG